MKNTSTLIFCLFIAFISNAQNDLTIFSEDGKPFFLHVNGVQQNTEASSNVKTQGITNGSAGLRIVFADHSAPDILKSMSFTEPNTETTGKIVMTKKGYKLRYFGEVPISNESTQAIEPQNTEIKEVVYLEEPAVPTEPQTTTVVTETVTIQSDMTMNDSPNAETINMNVGIDGINLNMGINIDDVMTEEYNQASTMTTTTTTTTTSESISVEPIETYEAAPVVESRCPIVMDDISRLKKLVLTESFSDDRLNLAKQGLKKSCISTANIMELAQLINFDGDRLEFVKYCYDRTIDQENFYELISVFDFSSHKDELQEFMNDQ